MKCTQKTKKHIGIVILMLLLCMTWSSVSNATSRVLEFDYSVNDSETYDMAMTIDTYFPFNSNSNTIQIDTDTSYTVSSISGDDVSFNCSTDNGTIQNGSDPADNLTDGSSNQTVTNGVGKTVSPVTSALFPDRDSDWTFTELDSDSDGLFLTTAVEPEDTWTQTITVKFDGSTEEVEISCELIEWTTYGGRNVGVIERTWSEPVDGETTSGKTISGTLSCTETLKFDYDNKIVVYSEVAKSGTIRYSNGYDQNYDVDIDVDATQTLQ